MEERKSTRVLLLNPDTGEVMGECDILTSAEHVLYTNTKETIGDFRGIPTSTSFSEVPIQNIMDSILYPEIPPQIKTINHSYFQNMTIDERYRPTNDHTIHKFFEIGQTIPSSTLTVYVTNGSVQDFSLILNIYADNQPVKTMTKDIHLFRDSKEIVTFELPLMTESTTITLGFRPEGFGGDIHSEVTIRFQAILPVYTGFIDDKIFSEYKVITEDKDMINRCITNAIDSFNISKYVGDITDIEQFVDTTGYLPSEKFHPFLLVPREWSDRVLIEYSNFNIVNNNFSVKQIEYYVGTTAYPYLLYVMNDVFYSNDPVLYGLKYRFKLSGFEKNLAGVIGKTNNSPLLSSFNMNTEHPIDNRFSVKTYEDLLKIQYKYPGLLCYVQDIKTYFKFDEDWKPACNILHLIETGNELTEELGGWDDVAMNVISGEVFKKHYNNKWEKWNTLQGTADTNGSTAQFRFRKEWDVLSTYVNDNNFIDIVTHNNKSWYCKVSNCSIEPGTNDNFWKIFNEN